MNSSIFDIIGPVMIGPSSSHTAGAARLARVARVIVGKPFHRVSFGLHGSFAKTYKGHGTDLALVAGALGLHEDDEALSDAFALAKANGLKYDFYEIDLGSYHDNSVKMSFYLDDGGESSILGSSLGGARIMIRKINGFAVEFSAQSSTLIIQQCDRKGVVSEVSRLLAENDINIGVMKLTRTAKGERAACVIETDSPIADSVLEEIKRLPYILELCSINLTQGEG